MAVISIAEKEEGDERQGKQDDQVAWPYFI
jgi:hypothetical protein